MQMRTERRDEAVFLRAHPPDPVRLYVCSGMCGTLHTLSLREWAVHVYVLRLTSLQRYHGTHGCRASSKTHDKTEPTSAISISRRVTRTAPLSGMRVVGWWRVHVVPGRVDEHIIMSTHHEKGRPRSTSAWAMRPLFMSITSRISRRMTSSSWITSSLPSANVSFVVGAPSLAFGSNVLLTLSFGDTAITFRVLTVSSHAAGVATELKGQNDT